VKPSSRKKRSEHKQQLGIGPRRGVAELLGADLVELAVAPFCGRS
jgi:hypothetical protein